MTAAVRAEVKLAVRTDRPEAIYEVGENVAFLIELTEDGRPVREAEVAYKLTVSDWWREPAQMLAIVDGEGSVTATREDPSVLWIEVTHGEGQDKVTFVAGAAFSPELIQPAMAEPADFDEFWAEQLARLRAVPPNVRLEPEDSGLENVELYAITMDNVNDTEIYGYLAKPKGDGPFPAMFQPQWAGVYSLDPNWIKWWANDGFLVLNINAHAIPNGKPAEYYKEQSEGELRDYPHIGSRSRETCYFLRMYLSCVRAVDYLTSRPEWDGEHLLVQGGSQGGGQSIVTAGLCPQVTAMAANVPALCDHGGGTVGRLPGWPFFVRWHDGEPDAQELETSRYFDAVNFARRVTCPSLVGTGFQDRVCSSASVYAAYNQIRGPKRVVVDPLSGHGGEKPEWGKAFGQFRERYGRGRGDWEL
jgi:cephalosporin-C deacetylase-like acetyl esterase